MMMIYVPVKFEFDWTNHFRVKSPETKNVDGQMGGQINGQKNGQRTDGITPISKGN